MNILIYSATDNVTSATESNKEVTITDKEGTVTHSANLWSEQKGNSRSTNVDVETPDSREFSNVYYSGGSSQPDEVHHTAITPNGNGTYTVEGSHYYAQDSWKGERKSDDGFYYVFTGESENTINYREQVVKADNAQEAEQRTNTMFPNEPSEHTYDVSEKTVIAQDKYTETGTRTDSVGTTTNYTNRNSSVTLTDHTYIGDTGKYVGWDWQWATCNNQVGDSTYSGSNYVVSEYKYSSSDDSWTKTTVWVTPKDGTNASIDDFKRDSASVDLNNYDVSRTDYVFDPSTDSGADNWKVVEQPDTSASESAAEEANAIALGNTTVTDGNGEVIRQQKAKENMVKLADEVQNTAKKDTTEAIFEAAVNELKKEDSDIGPIMNKVEEAYEKDVPVQGNTDDIVEHFHDMSGTVTTKVIPAEQSTTVPTTEQTAEAE